MTMGVAGMTVGMVGMTVGMVGMTVGCHPDPRGGITRCQASCDLGARSSRSGRKRFLHKAGMTMQVVGMRVKPVGITMETHYFSVHPSLLSVEVRGFFVGLVALGIV